MGAFIFGDTSFNTLDRGVMMNQFQVMMCATQAPISDILYCCENGGQPDRSIEWYEWKMLMEAAELIKRDADSLVAKLHGCNPSTPNDRAIAI
jgi:hypothetical protein